MRTERETRAACIRIGLPFANLAKHEISSHILELVPGAIARRYQVIPVAIKGDTLILATNASEDVLDRVLDASIDLQRRCCAALASWQDLDQRMVQYYPESGNQS